jgi:hypothetical protein
LVRGGSRKTTSRWSPWPGSCEMARPPAEGPWCLVGYPGREKPRGSFGRSFYPLGVHDPARTPTPKGWSPRGSRSDLSVSSGPVRGCPRTDKWEGRRAIPNMQARTYSFFREPVHDFASQSKRVSPPQSSRYRWDAASGHRPNQARSVHSVFEKLCGTGSGKTKGA